MTIVSWERQSRFVKQFDLHPCIHQEINKRVLDFIALFSNTIYSGCRRIMLWQLSRNFQSENGRKATLLSAELDNVLPTIDLSGSTTEFVFLLVEHLGGCYLYS